MNKKTYEIIYKALYQASDALENINRPLSDKINGALDTLYDWYNTQNKK